jgi:ABC-2 type transport system permease protein
VPVYDRRYRTFERPAQRAGSPVWILLRYGIGQVFESRFALILFVVACLPALGFATAIYIAHSAEAVAALRISDIGEFLEALSGRFFFFYMAGQSVWAFLFTAFVAPSLVAPDLAHGGLPLYLSRSLSRTQYVLGKLGILVVLLSALTWIPGLLLVGFQGALAEDGWLAAHARIPFAIVVGSWVWIGLLGLVALAVSAWIRWRPAATAALFGLFFIGSAFAAVVNGILDTRWGNLVSLSAIVRSIWVDLFGGLRAVPGMNLRETLPPSVAWFAFAAFLALAVLLLRRRIRAFEVVR